MKSLKKQRRIQIIAISAVALVVATALIGYAMRDGINYFRSPSEVISEPPSSDEIFRLGGLVKEGSVTPVDGVRFNFIITDGGGDIQVSYVGADPKPDLFNEGQGTIATGKFETGVFYATEILAKHDESYMPREVVDALKEQGVYQDPDAQ